MTHSEVHSDAQVLERCRAREALTEAANRFDRAYPELREDVRQLYAAITAAARLAERGRDVR